jgi:hypothetical protein
MDFSSHAAKSCNSFLVSPVYSILCLAAYPRDTLSARALATLTFLPSTASKMKE